MVNLPPTPPSGIAINGDTSGTEIITHVTTGDVTVTATLNDPNASDQVRMLVRVSTHRAFSSFRDYFSPYVATAHVATMALHGLSQNTHYYVRAYAQDQAGKFSTNFTSANFYTNRQPDLPSLSTPAENANIPIALAISFTWTFTDPDTGDAQTAFRLQYRSAATAEQPVGPWTLISGTTVTHGYLMAAGTLREGQTYEWRVKVKDLALWSEWSFVHSFFMVGGTTPPLPRHPSKGEAVDATLASLFTWKFVDGELGDVQTRADLRYRHVGESDGSWVYLFGTTTVPGANQKWLLPANQFVAGINYEWQVRTYDTISGLISAWSRSSTFWSIVTPGATVADVPAVPSSLVQGNLGSGIYRVFVYERGGHVLRGEITPLVDLSFSRKRDDISGLLLHTNGFGSDQCGFYGSLHCWAYEVVVFRNGRRVWEGPITRIEFQANSMELEAKDVMAYLYRRIMRQGFNDSYQIVDGVQIGLHSAVYRAQVITVNALAAYDPNVLPYLTVLAFPDDVRQSRVVPDYSQTAWEQVDDLAANAGLDYTTIGRRIIYWDTHRAIGRLPEMRDGDFDTSPIVSEYGMQMSNYEAVTNGDGIWGAATPKGVTDPFGIFGPIEILNSSYDSAAAAPVEITTTAQRAAMVANLEDQAARNISGRYPNPVIVRVPDNATLNPNVGIDFDQLVPGVLIPLRVTGTCRSVSQWQKLDSVTVNVSTSGEQVQVVMSPAPNGGNDPDADTGGDATP